MQGVLDESIRNGKAGHLEIGRPNIENPHPHPKLSSGIHPSSVTVGFFFTRFF
jgi:hypothetical protein